MNVDPNAHYSESHEWVRKEGDSFAYGITDHAQDQLSDLVYVEPPEIGESFEKDETIGVVESVKAASDIYSPLAGTIVEVNTNLEGTPGLVNSDPYGDGWLFKVKTDNADDVNKLMSASEYKNLEEE